MKSIIKRKTHIIDAKDRSLGRLASEIALLLQGKHKPDYAPHKDIGDRVVIRNLDKIKFSGRKIDKKNFYYHTTFPKGLKTTPLRKFLEKNPFKVLELAVLGMLPKNKLRKRMISRLKIEDFSKN